MYIIQTRRERYSVDAAGNIGRPSIGMKPSGQWTVHGATRHNNFGRRVEFRHFPECMQITDWCHGNGAPKWRLIDIDHGTARAWGEAIYFTRTVQS